MAFKRQNHSQWITLRKRIERNQEINSSDDGGSKSKKSKQFDFNPKDLVECPRSYDVIIGKAKYKNNPGNVFYRSLIEATHGEHTSSCKKEKVELTWWIVREMEKRKGRFLEMNKSLKAWVHIKDRNIVRQKVAQSYKEFKRKKRDLHQQLDPSTPIIPLKRTRTVTNPMFETDRCDGGCFFGGKTDNTRHKYTQ